MQPNSTEPRLSSPNLTATHTGPLAGAYDPERYFSFNSFPVLTRTRLVCLLIALHVLCGTQLATHVVMAFLLIPLHLEFAPSLPILALLPMLQLLVHSIALPFILRLMEPHSLNARLAQSNTLRNNAGIPILFACILGCASLTALGVSTSIGLAAISAAFVGLFSTVALSLARHALVDFAAIDTRLSDRIHVVAVLFGATGIGVWLGHLTLSSSDAALFFILARGSDSSSKIDRYRSACFLLAFLSIVFAMGACFLLRGLGPDPRLIVATARARFSLSSMSEDSGDLSRDKRSSQSDEYPVNMPLPKWFQLLLSPRSPLLHSSLTSWMVSANIHTHFYYQQSQMAQESGYGIPSIDAFPYPSLAVQQRNAGLEGASSVARAQKNRSPLLAKATSQSGSQSLRSMMQHKELAYDPHSDPALTALKPNSTFKLAIFMGTMGNFVYRSMVFFPMSLMYNEVNVYIIGCAVGFYYAGGSLGGIIGRMIVSRFHRDLRSVKRVLLVCLCALTLMMPLTYLNIVLLPNSPDAVTWILPISAFLSSFIPNATLEAIVLFSICFSVPPPLYDQASFWDATIEDFFSSSGPMIVALLTEKMFGFSKSVNPLDDEDDGELDDNALSLQRGIFWLSTICWTLAVLAGILLYRTKSLKIILDYSSQSVF